ncbi:TetR/AcrR family transcriptional regulator [Agrobacterium rhizogenes]|nr:MULTISPECIES: TetR/AcrR family transcriptional regulator [Rhizobium]EJK88038.1 transcriptional regulator [Rhizobium sp. AP16]NTI43733.1 TetR/AcrR family transcriptional regulator [Rhizobium rhizogenes]NTI63708.1 TetR/AcrR family transcriptional regulator [Rhizobium rhizogenes]OCJ18993.1 TetR family transcriptional regulator [Agrobacterium sp. B131/95]
MARPQEFDTADVLNKAMQLFWNKGFESVSLTELLKATGLSKSSLYGTFGNKRELFLAAYDVYRVARAHELEITLNKGLARNALETFFCKIIADARAVEFTSGCMSTNQAVEMAPYDPQVRGRVEADFQLIEDAFASTIERGRADGSIKSSRSSREIASLLVVAFPGFQVMVRAGAGEARLETALNVLLSNLDT